MLKFNAYIFHIGNAHLNYHLFILNYHVLIIIILFKNFILNQLLIIFLIIPVVVSKALSVSAFRLRMHFQWFATRQRFPKLVSRYFAVLVKG